MSDKEKRIILPTIHISKRLKAYKTKTPPHPRKQVERRNVTLMELRNIKSLSKRPLHEVLQNPPHSSLFRRLPILFKTSIPPEKWASLWPTYSYSWQIFVCSEDFFYILFKTCLNFVNNPAVVESSPHGITSILFSRRPFAAGCLELKFSFELFWLSLCLGGFGEA